MRSKDVSQLFSCFNKKLLSFLFLIGDFNYLNLDGVGVWIDNVRDWCVIFVTDLYCI